MNGQPTSPAPWHLPTAIGFGAFAWILLMAGHEILGHGTAFVALGGDAISVDAMYFACTELSAPWKDQLYRAAGSVFNLLGVPLEKGWLNAAAIPCGYPLGRWGLAKRAPVQDVVYEERRNPSGAEHSGDGTPWVWPHVPD